MKNVVEQFLEFLIKIMFEGIFMDGFVFVDLVKYLVDIMNENVWLDFGNVYVMFERNICKRYYVNFVEFFFLFKVDEIIFIMEMILNKFKNECVLESEIKVVEENFKSVVKVKKKLEELDRKFKEVEDK